MARLTLLSLGSINADFQVRVADPPGSSETLLAHDFCRLSGGKASNTAYLAACFGHRSVLLGRVGDDDLAEQVLTPLRDAGVELGGVSRAAGKASGVSMIMVPPGAKKHIVLATNANDAWDQAAVDAVCALIAATEPPACLVLDYEIPAWVVRQAIETASRCEIPVILDPSFPDRLEPDLLNKLLAMTPNVAEAEGILGSRIESTADAVGGARQLYEAGVKIACIKLADGGCVLATEDGVMQVPPGDVEPVDTTGAGDAFTGVFAIALLEEREPLEAAAWAVAAANIAVTGYGSQPAYAGRKQVEAMAVELLKKAGAIDG